MPTDQRFIYRELFSANYHLRKYTEADVKDVFAIYSDPEVMKYAGPDLHKTMEDSLEFIRMTEKDIAEKRGMFWAICRPDNPKVLGDISLLGVDWKHGFASFAPFLARENWHQGIISELLPVIINFAFCNLGLNRLESQVYTDHASSIRMLERAGFKREGELRQNFLIGGSYCNSYVYGLIKEECLTSVSED